MQNFKTKTRVSQRILSQPRMGSELDASLSKLPMNFCKHWIRPDTLFPQFVVRAQIVGVEAVTDRSTVTGSLN
jgi:hypothetical protein